MRVLLTGATGYIGKRLLPVLVEAGHIVICCVRDRQKFHPEPSLLKHIEIVEIDFTNADTLSNLPDQIEAAYYLIHSMSSTHDFMEMERQSASNFSQKMSAMGVRQVIYLGGIVNDEKLSHHLSSRKVVEEILKKGTYATTALRAGIIIGSGSASFEIIRDLVEKLPVMIAPKWLNTRCQPIGIADVIKMLTGVLNREESFDQSYDIGCEEVLTYKEMLLKFAEVRGLRRWILTVPIMSPRISSYWLYFITSTSYSLAVSLVDSMKVEVVAKDLRLNKLLKIEPLSYKQCISQAFLKIEQNTILSSWKDATASGILQFKISDYINVPSFGCLKDERQKEVISPEESKKLIWKIGGETGWYYGNYLWRLRGFLDKLFGGVGLRRGRTHPTQIQAGDTLDFWRVLYANREEGRLLLFAEMKLPGEAWLEFNLQNNRLTQTATFRPKGVWGRVYWYLLLPFHHFIFQGMMNAIADGKSHSI